MVDNFRWPSHIMFDDTEADINEARRVWLANRDHEESGRIADFLEFMEAYARELEVRRRLLHSSTQKLA
jgi:hypothetical protein